MGERVNLYKLSASFERAVLHHLIMTPSFWTRVGSVVETDAFSGDVERMVAAAAFAVGKDSGSAAGSGTIVVQRLSRWMEEGRINNEQVLDCEDLVGDLEDLDPPDVDSVVAEFLPIVKERRNREALHLGMKRLARREDFSDVIDHMRETENLGDAKIVSGIDIGPETLDHMKRIHRTSRLPTGIPELDVELGGGPRSDTIAIVMGDSGDGKSMFLTHVAGSAIIRGVNTLVATLELDDEQWSTRLLANLTGIPIDAIEDRSMADECAERLRGLKLGRCRVEQFTAGVTKVDDILTWARDVEKREGWTAQLLVVDYADLLGHSKAREYEGMREVYGGLREGWSVARHGWCWSGCQARRRQKSSEKAGAGDAADSQHKVRVSDIWVVLNANEDASEIDYSITKHRGGKRGAVVTLPTELECARVCPIITDAPEDVDDGFDLF
jgi:replicative DNA helicase